MTETILAEIFELHQHETDSHDTEFMAVWQRIKSDLGYEVSEQLFSAVQCDLYDAKFEGFKAGWQMRSQL